jgi:cupin superfamily protein
LPFRRWLAQDADFMSLDYLISPYHREVFFQDYWEQQVLYLKRNDSSYFSFLREDLQVEQLIWQTCHAWGDVSLARSHTSYETAPYAALQPNVSTIRKAFADDYTIIINNLERKSVRIAQFCRDVEKDCFFNSNINLYYTKANTQGLDYHYDTEDVFIMQLEGAKVWRIYEIKADLPLGDEAYEPINCDSTPFKEYDLNPGDVLYIPRGIVHEAHARDRDSIHLTLSVSVIRWASLLQRLVRIAARNDTEFRKAVPVELLRLNETPLFQSNVGVLLNRLGNENYLAVTISELQDRLLCAKSRLPMADNLDGTVVNEIRLESEASIAQDQVYMLSESDHGLFLKFIGASIELSGELGEAIRFMCERQNFFVHELPGDLSSTEKLSLVRRLVHCEFLTVSR